MHIIALSDLPQLPNCISLLSTQCVLATLPLPVLKEAMTILDSVPSAGNALSPGQDAGLFPFLQDLSNPILPY